MNNQAKNTFIRRNFTVKIEIKSINGIIFAVL